MKLEDRLRDHLRSKASTIDVPDHRFVETKVIPFQPRRRPAPIWAAVAALVVLIVGGFAFLTGRLDSIASGDEAAIIPSLPGVNRSSPDTHLTWTSAIESVDGPISMVEDQGTVWVFGPAATDPYPHGLAARSSVDGSTWANLGPVIDSSLTFYTVTAEDGRFVAVGSHDAVPFDPPQLFTSTDGQTWQPVTLPFPPDWIGQPVITPAGLYVDLHVSRAIDSYRQAYSALDPDTQRLVDERALVIEVEDQREMIQITAFGSLPYAAFTFAELGVIADESIPRETVSRFFTSDYQTWVESSQLPDDFLTLATLDTAAGLAVIGTSAVLSTEDGLDFTVTNVDPAVQIGAWFDGRWLGVDQSGVVRLSGDLREWTAAFSQPIVMDAVTMIPIRVQGGPAGVLVALGYPAQPGGVVTEVQLGDDQPTVTAAGDGWTVTDGRTLLELPRGADNRSHLDLDAERVVILGDDGRPLWNGSREEVTAAARHLARPAPSAGVAFSADLEGWVVDPMTALAGPDAWLRSMQVADEYVVVEVFDGLTSAIWVGRNNG